MPSGVLEQPGRNVITISRDEFARAVRLHQAGDLGVAARLYESVLDGDARPCRRAPPAGRGAAPAGPAHLRRRPDRQGTGPPARSRPVTTRRWPRSIVPWASSKKLSPAVARRSGSGSTIPLLATTSVWPCMSWAGMPRPPVPSWRPSIRDPTTRLAHTNLGRGPTRTGRQRAGRSNTWSGPLELAPQLAPRGTISANSCWNLVAPAMRSAHCQAAVALQPEMPEAHNNLGNAYRALGRLAEARVVLRRGGPATTRRCPKPASALPLILQQEGRWDEALPWLRRATELKPGLSRLPRPSGRSRRRTRAVCRGHHVLSDRLSNVIPARATAHNALGMAFAGGRPA